MNYEFMRIIVFFDLPVKTKKDRKVYASFRKYLIEQGYMMLQFSVYCKLSNNRDASKQHIDHVKRNTPQKGHVRIMLLTEKQFSNMIIVIGGKSFQEHTITIEPLMII